MTNIGKKPTVSGEDVIGIETFIMDFDKDIYGEDVVVKLLHFQRPETKFADISQLKEQMHKDKKECVRIYPEVLILWGFTKRDLTVYRYFAE